MHHDHCNNENESEKTQVIIKQHITKYREQKCKKVQATTKAKYIQEATINDKY